MAAKDPLAEPPSSMLVAFLPGPVGLETLRDRLAGFGPVETREEHVAVAVPAVSGAPVEVGPVAMPSEGLARTIRRDAFAAARLDLAREALGLRASLRADDPLAALQGLYRMGLAATAGEALLWYDAAKEHHVDREEVSLFANEDVSLSVEQAIRIDGVFADRDAPTYWIHTHGLARLGRPDLEAFEVPRALWGEGGRLVNEVAAWLIERERLHGPIEVHLAGEHVRLEPLGPWIDRLPPGTLGKDPSDRNPDELQTGRRMAIVVPRRRGRGRVFRRTFTHDLRALLEKRDACEVRPLSSTEGRRLAAVARRTRPLLQALWDRRAPGWTFLVKLGLPMASEPEVREHLWFEAVDVDGDRLLGRLENVPDDVALVRGDVVDRDLALATDWRVTVGGVGYGPTRAHRLLEPPATAAS